MNKSPAFQLYSNDFLVGTMGMSDEEVGVYMKMLCLQWDRGSLPNDAVSIKKLINSKRVPSEIVMSKFQKGDDGFRRNARLEKERQKQTDFRDSRVKAGSQGGKKKAENAIANSSTATILLDEKSKQNLALQSSSSSSDIISLKRDIVAPTENTSVEPLPKKTVEEVMSELKATGAYDGIDTAVELKRMQAWRLIPKNRNRQINYRFIVSWLNKCDVPLKQSGESSASSDSWDKQMAERDEVLKGGF